MCVLRLVMGSSIALLALMECEC